MSKDKISEIGISEASRCRVQILVFRHVAIKIRFVNLRLVQGQGSARFCAHKWGKRHASIKLCFVLLHHLRQFDPVIDRALTGFICQPPGSKAQSGCHPPPCQPEFYWHSDQSSFLRGFRISGFSMFFRAPLLDVSSVLKEISYFGGESFIVGCLRDVFD